MQKSNINEFHAVASPGRSPQGGLMFGAESTSVDSLSLAFPGGAATGFERVDRALGPASNRIRSRIVGAPVGNRFCKMILVNKVDTLEVGYGAGHFQDAMAGAN